MISHKTAGFQREFDRLPASVQQQARAAYRLFRRDPQHPSLRFRQVHAVEPVYSARVGRHYRAVGVRDGEEIAWFWIGSHAEYDQLLARL